MVAYLSIVTSESKEFEFHEVNEGLPEELPEEEHQVRREKTKKKFAGVIFIGPIPIVIASDRKTGIIAFIISLILFLMIISVILYFGWV